MSELCFSHVTSQSPTLTISIVYCRWTTPIYSINVFWVFNNTRVDPGAPALNKAGGGGCLDARRSMYDRASARRRKAASLSGVIFARHGASARVNSSSRSVLYLNIDASQNSVCCELYQTVCENRRRRSCQRPCGSREWRSHPARWCEYQPVRVDTIGASALPELAKAWR